MRVYYDLQALSMALPVSLHASTTPQELEFVAGYEMIEIMPSVQTDRIRVLSVSKARVEMHDASGQILVFPNNRVHMVPLMLSELPRCLSGWHSI